MFASVSFGAQTATIEVLNPPSDNIAAGYYIGPYQALVNGVPTNVICDDFAADTPMNTPWDVTVMSVADLTNPLVVGQVRWASSATVETYQQAAWLALQLSAASPSVPCLISTGNCGADIQFAIWSLFDQDAYTHYAANGPSVPLVNALSVNYWLGQAGAHYDDAGVNYARVLIYTPNPIEGGPQEFLSVTAPEPSTLLLLGLNGLGVVGLVWFARKRPTEN
jgi:hypothetical protein